MSLAAVRDLRDVRVVAGPDELAAFETDVLAGFVLARAAAGLADATIRSDVLHLEQLRAWFGRPLWDMEPADADAYFGKVLRDAAKGTRLGRSQALRTYFLFLEIRHKVNQSVAWCPPVEAAAKLWMVDIAGACGVDHLTGSCVRLVEKCARAWPSWSPGGCRENFPAGPGRCLYSPGTAQRHRDVSADSPTRRWP